MLYAWYMESHLFEEFPAVITSITPFGMFVSLMNGVEGLVSFKDMNGYFEYNEISMLATNGKDTYRLGDRVRVVLISSRRETRKIDFVLEKDYD